MHTLADEQVHNIAPLYLGISIAPFQSNSAHLLSNVCPVSALKHRQIMNVLKTISGRAIHKFVDRVVANTKYVAVQS